jgi:hypothetical protein
MIGECQEGIAVDVTSTDTLAFFLLGGGGGSTKPSDKGELERLRFDRADERLPVCDRVPGRRPADSARLGVRSLEVLLPVLALLPLALILFFWNVK